MGKGICIPGPHGIITIGKIVLDRMPPPGHCTGSGLKHTSSLLMKRTIYLSWRFSLRDRLQVCTHLESTEAFLGNVRHHSCILPWPSWVHWYFPERSLYTCLEVWFTEMIPKGHLQISWSEGQRAYEYGLQDYIFEYFKTCSPSIWLSNSLKLSTKWDPSPWNTEKSWHTFNNRNLSRINHAVR